jgi:hypothetical protein
VGPPTLSVTCGAFPAFGDRFPSVFPTEIRGVALGGIRHRLVPGPFPPGRRRDRAASASTAPPKLSGEWWPLTLSTVAADIPTNPPTSQAGPPCWSSHVTAVWRRVCCVTLPARQGSGSGRCHVCATAACAPAVARDRRGSLSLLRRRLAGRQAVVDALLKVDIRTPLGRRGRGGCDRGCPRSGVESDQDEASEVAEPILGGQDHRALPRAAMDRRGFALPPACPKQIGRLLSGQPASPRRSRRGKEDANVYAVQAFLRMVVIAAFRHSR